MDVALRTCKLEEHKQVEIFGPDELEMFRKSSSHYWHGTLSRNSPGTRRVRPRFCILKVLGDVLDDGELHLVERAKTFEAARRRIKVLAEATPGQYVICNGETGERLLMNAPSVPSLVG